jgi:hypothetical protein
MCISFTAGIVEQALLEDQYANRIGLVVLSELLLYLNEISMFKKWIKVICTLVENQLHDKY